MAKFVKKKLREEILREAKVLNMHSGSAEMIADRVIEKVGKWADKRTDMTKEDLDRVTAKALEEYDEDLAYVYKNRGKII